MLLLRAPMVGGGAALKGLAAAADATAAAYLHAMHTMHTLITLAPHRHRTNLPRDAEGDCKTDRGPVGKKDKGKAMGRTFLVVLCASLSLSMLTTLRFPDFLHDMLHVSSVDHLLSPFIAGQAAFVNSLIPDISTWLAWRSNGSLLIHLIQKGVCRMTCRRVVHFLTNINAAFLNIIQGAGMACLGISKQRFCDSNAPGMVGKWPCAASAAHDLAQVRVLGGVGGWGGGGGRGGAGRLKYGRTHPSLAEAAACSAAI